MSSLAAFNRVMRVLQTYANVPASEVRALAQELDDIPGAGGPSSTLEDLTIPVDYNAPGAIDVPSDARFSSQADVAKALGSAPAFKHLQLVYNALPATVDHIVTVNLAAGVHRPHPTFQGGFTAWGFASKTMGLGGAFKLVGAAPSLYAQKSGLTYPIAVTSIQANSGDPFINVSGTPFVANALRGWYAVLNTGQVALIHENTTSRLNVMAALSPAPTSILFIGRPSTVLRNSLNDAAHLPLNTSGALETGTNNFNFAYPGNRISLQDVTVDPFGAHSNMFYHGSGQLDLTRHILDQDTINDFGGGPDGNGWSFGGFCTMVDSAFIDRLASSSADGLMFVNGSLGGFFGYGNYFESSENAIQCKYGAFFSSYGNVFRHVGHVDAETFGSLQVTNGGNLDMGDFGYGKTNEFREGTASVPSIWLAGGNTQRPDFQLATFRTNVEAAVRIGPRGTLDVSASGAGGGFKDGGGNSDVGIDIVGPSSVASLNTGTNVTGTAGNVRLGGSVVTYASIPSTGTGHLNTVSAARRA